MDPANGQGSSDYTNKGGLSRYVVSGEYEGVGIKVITNAYDIITAFTLGK